MIRELNSSTEIGLTLTILKAMIRTIKPLNLNAPLYCKNKEYERIDKCFHDLTKMIGSLSQENALEISFYGLVVWATFTLSFNPFQNDIESTDKKF